jgi:uncharacterized lipoprotein YajG
VLAPIDVLTQYALSKSNIMNKYICILAAAALLAACEQKTETTAPEASPAATATSETTAAPELTPTPSPATP